MPELAQTHLDYVDIDSGHWRMFSQAIERAWLLAQTAAGT